MRVLVGFLLIWFGLAASAPAANCRIERLPQAKAACLEYRVDQEILRMDSAIAAATSDLQAATAPEIMAFEARLRRTQAQWREGAERACRDNAGADPVRFQACRLAAATARRDLLETTLSDLRTRLGAGPDYDIAIPEAVEVLIPLEVPGGNGPDGEVRVPLVVPLTPQ